MPKFGKTSKERLNTAKLCLQDLFNIVVQDYDCSILCGHRNQLHQDAAFNSGASKVSWPNSRHNSFPAQAVDVAPYPIDWGETGTTNERQKAIARFYHFAGYVTHVSENENIPVRWGGDWDGDKIFSDQKFDDLVHWELL